jgi:hypothetical protein
MLGLAYILMDTKKAYAIWLDAMPPLLVDYYHCAVELAELMGSNIVKRRAFLANGGGPLGRVRKSDTGFFIYKAAANRHAASFITNEQAQLRRYIARRVVGFFSSVSERRAAPL